MIADYGIFLVPALFMLCFGLLAYASLQALREGMDNYASVYTEDTARQYEDLFLFIPAKRIADLARVSAVIAFILCFLLFGNLRSQGGMFAGAFFGGVAAVGALFAPRIILRVLRRRRLDRFNLQLVDGLISMSSALKAGFSIAQSFETVMKQGQNPIAQEFALFLQQIRVGVRFEDALHNMEERVGSEDLTLMNQSIEISRQTGGNLTEVFEKIASTIRERMRIQQRIKSLTAQGRLQGIVVGSIPLLLLFAMTMLDPKLMIPFFTSKIGIGLIVLTALLVFGGAMVIRKIIRIEI